MEPFPRVFSMLQYFETIFPAVDLDLLNKMRHILWVVALLEACDVTNNGRHLGCHLGFYQEFKISLRPQERVIFFVLETKNNTQALCMILATRVEKNIYFRLKMA